MFVEYVQLKIAHDERTVYNIFVAPWEVPVLEAVHGKELIEIVGAMRTQREFPDAEKEHERLSMKYKRNNETGSEYVAMVYGGGTMGANALRNAIDQARAEQASKYEEPTGDFGEDADPSLEDMLGASPPPPAPKTRAAKVATAVDQ